MGQLPILIEAFEYALSVLPKSQVQNSLKPEQHLFFFYYQIQDFARASKQAGKLRQTFPGAANLYTMWSVVANYHAFVRGGAGPMYLTLVEKTLGKLRDEGHLKSGEDLSFHCSVLQKAGKWAEARALVEGPAGRSAFPFEEERLKMLASILKGIPDVPKEQVLQCFVDLIKCSPDDWDAWKGAIDAAMMGDEALMTRVLDLSRDVSASARSKRGPRLAQLEVALRRGDLKSVESLLLQYFDTFGNRASFWGDCGRYAVALGEAQRAALLAELKSRLKPVDWSTQYPLLEPAPGALDDPNDPHCAKRDGRNAGKVDQWGPEDEDRQSEMMRRVSIAKLEYTLAVVTERPTQLDQCAELLRQFGCGCSLYRKHLQVTEEGPNDDLGLLSAHYLLHRLDSRLGAAAVCHSMLVTTPYAFQPKLLLIRIAESLGAFAYVKELYKALDIKYIQQDSMGHYTLYAAFQSGDASWYTKLHENAVDWFEVYIRRVPKDTLKCFENGKWTQIDGFVAFAQRCQNSWHMATLFVESLLAKQLNGGAEKHWDLDSLKAGFHAAREQGLVSGWRQSTQWIEDVAAACDTAGSLSYNYDRRAQADFSPAGLRTKEEWDSIEWVVPAEEGAWLKSRTLLLLLLEAQSKADWESSGTLVARLKELWLQQGVLASGTRNRLASSACYVVLAALLDVTTSMHAMLAGSATASLLAAAVAAMKTASGQLAELSAVFGAASQDTSHAAFVDGRGLVSDASFCSFELLPLALVQLRVWRANLPTKGMRNRMDADAKVQMTELSTASKQVADACATLSESVVAYLASYQAGKLRGGHHVPSFVDAVSIDHVCSQIEAAWVDLGKHAKLSSHALLAALAGFQSKV